MGWGELTWILFHTMAEKIHEQKYKQVKTELLSFIRLICQVLPCPECAKDAANTLNTMNVKKINTKTEFKQFLFQFHNTVNKKLKKEVLPISILNKYKSANLNKILKTWLQHFKFTGGMNKRLIGVSMQRKQIKHAFYQFMFKHQQHFN